MTDHINVTLAAARSCKDSPIAADCSGMNEKSTSCMVELRNLSSVLIMTASAAQAPASRGKRI